MSISLSPRITPLNSPRNSFNNQMVASLKRSDKADKKPEILF